MEILNVSEILGSIYLSSVADEPVSDVNIVFPQTIIASVTIRSGF